MKGDQRYVTLQPASDRGAAQTRVVKMCRIYCPGAFACLVAVSAVPAVLAQAPDTLWTKAYGGPGTETASEVQQTEDGGYVIVGTTNSFGAGGNDIYLIRTDAVGDTLWTRTYGGAESESGNSVCETSDGGFIIVGDTYSFAEHGNDVYLIKTDTNGDTVWTRTYGAEPQWWPYDDKRYDRGHSVRQTADGGFVIVGATNDFDGYFFYGEDVYLIRTDASGGILWENIFPSGPAGAWEYGLSVVEASDSGYVLTGLWNDHSRCLIKMSKDGSDEWARASYECNYAIGRSVDRTSDGGYIITGLRQDCEGHNYLLLWKTDELGNTVWERDFGGVAMHQGYSVKETIEGGYVAVGHSPCPGGGCGWEVYLLKCNPSGDTLWTSTYGGPNDQMGASVEQTDDLGYIIAGWTNATPGGDKDIYLLKTEPEDVSGLDAQDVSGRCSLDLLCMPNPSRSGFTIRYRLTSVANMRLAIYDLRGRHVRTVLGMVRSAGEHSIIWDGTDTNGHRVSPGVYFCEAQAGGLSDIRKVVIVD